MKRNSFAAVAGAALAVGMLLLSAGPAWGQTAETLWSQAEELRRLGQNEAAVQAYERIALEWPKSERAAQAALRAADLYQKLGRTADALVVCEKAVALANDFWLQPALFSNASICRLVGCRDEALGAIQRLRAEYPESRWTVRAGVLEAEILGVDASRAQAALQQDVEAAKTYALVVKLVREKQIEQAIGLLQAMAAMYPDSPASLRALDAQGHLLLRLSRTAEAKPVFAEILVRIGQTAPSARIVRRAKARLGTLCRATGAVTEAEQVFADLARNSSKPAVASRAALELIGMDYEWLRKQYAQLLKVDASGWAALRQKCQDLAGASWCQPRERVRAELVAVESYYWQDDADGAAQAGAAFLAKYDGPAFTHELFTARLFVGLVLRDAGRYAEALEHFGWILEHVPNPGPRVYRELWTTLRRQGAPAEEVEQVEAALKATYPTAASLRYIEIIKRQEAAR